MGVQGLGEDGNPQVGQVRLCVGGGRSMCVLGGGGRRMCMRAPACVSAPVLL